METARNDNGVDMDITAENGTVYRFFLSDDMNAIHTVMDLDSGEWVIRTEA